MTNNFLKQKSPLSKKENYYRTDNQWKIIGDNEPYFGVLSASKFKKNNLDSASLEDFFSSGEIFIDKLFDIVYQKIDKSFVPNNSIEFGCGVGRLLIPLSKRSNKVLGIDISDAMLFEAKKNLLSRNISNFTLLKSDDTLSQVNQKFNFAISFIVFQHIPPQRGNKIFRNLLNKLEEGGIGIFHFVYYSKPSNFKKPDPDFKNIVMEMNAYDINSLAFIIQNNRCNIEHTMFTNHMGYLGVAFFVRKNKVHLL